MIRTLFTWIRQKYLDAGKESRSPGPIASTWRAQFFDRSHLLYSYSPEEITFYTDWLEKKIQLKVIMLAATQTTLRSLIYQLADALLQRITTEQSQANHNVPVLIEGGIGKELFATTIHNVWSQQSGPLQLLSCGAIPKDLKGGL